MINALFDAPNPGMAARVIHMGDDPVGAVSRVLGRIEAGELVGMFADRVGLNDRVVRVPFCGAEASFAAGPFLLASLLRCPVYLVFGLYRDPDRYELFCEPLAERIELPRGRREEALAVYARRYAERLEFYARKAPENWFNWFDFWGPA
jgi:predicted LPLAT superfamily acyltransferase